MNTTDQTLYEARQEDGQVIVAGPFDDELHHQLKRLGGQWDGKKGTNRRVWVIRKGSAERVRQVLHLFERDQGERVRGRIEQEQRRREARREALEAAPHIEPGQYGPIKVEVRNNAYALDFGYDKALVERIRTLQGRRFDKERKVWIIDAANAAALKVILQDVATGCTPPPQGQVNAPAVESAQPQQEPRIPTRSDGAAQASAATNTAVTDHRFLYPVGDFEPVLEQPVRLGPKAVVFVTRGKPFRIDESAPAAHGPHLLGQVGQQGRYSYYRPATLEEAQALTAQEQRARQRRDRYTHNVRVLRKAEVAIRATGARPDYPARPEGKVYYDTFRPDGTGSRFIIGSDWIWFVLNNGAPWADSSLNNVSTGGAGAMGWRVPYQETLADQIRNPGNHSADKEAGR